MPRSLHAARLIVVFLFCSMFLTAPALSAADGGGAETLTTTEDLDKDEFLGRISMAYLRNGFRDRVDGFSGYLHINMVDIRLPGNSGMEIVVQRGMSQPSDASENSRVSETLRNGASAEARDLRCSRRMTLKSVEYHEKLVAQ